LRRGIGLIWALIILILISFMFVFIAKVSFISSKHLGNSYAIQRAELFMQSCIENALLGIEGYDRSSECLTHMKFLDESHKLECNVNILRYYCYKDENCPCGDLTKVIKTDFSNGYVLMNVEVNSSIYNIKLSKTTLQRP